MIKTELFIRKPFEIEAVQVTEENMSEVAEWCQGDVRNASDTNESPAFIKVRVHHPLTDRQTKAFVGDWVLYAGKGYKVYTDKGFKTSFEPMVVYTDTDVDAQIESLKEVPENV